MPYSSIGPLYSHSFFAVLVVYLLSFVFYCLRLIFRKKDFTLTALRLVILAFIAHASVLVIHFISQGYPYLRSSFETFQMTSLLIVLGYLILTFFFRFLTTGIFFVGLSLVFYITALTHIVAWQLPGTILENPWAFIHLLCIFMAMAVFALSVSTGLLYLIQEYRIKHKKMGGFLDRFPSLSSMDTIHYRALYLGFVFFTFGIVTGGGWSKSTQGVYITGDIKQMISFGVWVFFALFLNLRVSHGWVGRKGILLSFIGFAGIFFLFLWTQN